ncbi:MAG: small acid-soluble spore protein Tlp [Firmicutes bacterium]|nr:small acid-soluble spore protein Tlp [Bacillota bacterium]
MSRGPKPDNRKDNVEKLREQIVDTIENIEESHDTLQRDLADEQKEEIRAKNRRREQAIADKRDELRDEYAFQQKQED